MLKQTLKLTSKLGSTAVDVLDTLLDGTNCGIDTVTETVKNMVHTDYKQNPRILILGSKVSEDKLFNAIQDILDDLQVKSISSFIVQEKSDIEPMVKQLGKSNSVDVQAIKSTLFLNKDKFDVALFIGNEETNTKLVQRLLATNNPVYIEPIE